MQLILLIGIPGCGKSTFYWQQFANSHLRISRDLLKTKAREQTLIEFCCNSNMPCVIDNTNLTPDIRTPLMQTFKQAQFKCTGYYFKTDLNRSLAQNKRREGNACIPDVAIFDAHQRLILPTYDEGFDTLYYVDYDQQTFMIKDWQR